jgi:hypothetical protein
MEHVSSYDYENGAKLMEHSYIGNNFVEAVEFLLINDGEDKGRWANSRIVWAGDYADPEEPEEDAENIYTKVSINKGLQFLIEGVPSNYPYLVNWDKKEYLDKRKCPYFGDKHDWQIHPLPLLTCEGNGRGGGDYRNDNDYVGTWSRCVVNLMKEIPEGFTEITPNFVE